MHNLTNQQIKFCENWIKNGGNGMQAAIAAGYSPKAAGAQSTRLLKNDKVIDYIQKRRTKGEIDKLVAETNDILKFWSDIMTNNIDELEVDAVPLSDRLRASEYLAKTSGMFSERVILQNAGDNALNVSFTVVDNTESG